MDDEEILGLHRAFEDAELAGDGVRLAELLADDFRSIGEQGFVLDREQWIGRFAEFRYQSVEASEVEVRRYGAAAIVRYVQHSRASWLGEELDLWTRASQTWVELPGGWRLAGIQFSGYSPPDGLSPTDR